MGKAKIWTPPGAEEGGFGCDSRGAGAAYPLKFTQLLLLQLVPVTTRELGPFSPGQCPNASGRILYNLPWWFSAAVNTHGSINSLTSVVGEQLAADLRAAQQAACQLPRYNEFYVHHQLDD